MPTMICVVEEHSFPIFNYLDTEQQIWLNSYWIKTVKHPLLFFIFDGMNLLDFIVSTETARQNERFSARSSTNTGGLQIAHNGCYATPTLASEGRISLIDNERA